MRKSKKANQETDTRIPLSCHCGNTTFRRHGSLEDGQIRWRCEACGSRRQNKFTYADVPKDASRNIDEILKARLSEEKRVFEAEKFNNNLCVDFKHNDPIALVLFGDPHLDDKGTAISRVLEDLDHVKNNQNVFGVCVGDITNNWVGRLMALYGEQETTIPESWTMAEWFFSYIPWLAVVLGNHDKWNSGVEILKRMSAGKLVQADECSFKLTFLNGTDITVNARHKWKGVSQWNPAHGVSKYAQMGGDYDLILGGHTHQSAYAQVLGNRKHTISHCVQLASYKVHDSYARSEGFRAHNIAPSMCVVIDPLAKRAEDKIIVTYSVPKGIMLKDAIARSRVPKTTKNKKSKVGTDEDLPE
jgi:predicted phosphodiesterase